VCSNDGAEECRAGKGVNIMSKKKDDKKGKKKDGKKGKKK
jgi:hypothetical protein